jgi:hypothetical protein
VSTRPTSGAPRQPLMYAAPFPPLCNRKTIHRRHYLYLPYDSTAHVIHGFWALAGLSTLLHRLLPECHEAEMSVAHFLTWRIQRIPPVAFVRRPCHHVRSRHRMQSVIGGDGTIGASRHHCR